MLSKTCYELSLIYSLTFSIAGIIIFTVLCGFTYDQGMSDKYGGLRRSTIYNANVANYVVCESDDTFDMYQPVVSFERFGEIVNCVLRSRGSDDNNCKDLSEIQYKFPYGSNVDVYLNVNKSPFCVTQNYLEDNAYLGFQFLITDIAFLLWFILATIATCVFCGNCSRNNVTDNNINIRNWLTSANNAGNNVNTGNPV